MILDGLRAKVLSPFFLCQPVKYQARIILYLLILEVLVNPVPGVILEVVTTPYGGPGLPGLDPGLAEVEILGCRHL